MYKIRVMLIMLFFLLLVARPDVCQSVDSHDLSGAYQGCNVILLTLDALRPDHLGCYGYTRDTSPNIDLLAQEGVLFTNAFSQSSLTLPSVTSIYTGLYPFSHRVKYVFKDRLPNRVYTLAQILHIYGYATVWFGSLEDPHTGSAPGLLKGFDEKYELRDRKILLWIEQHKKDNFFITIHDYRVHDQNFPIKRYSNSFSRQIPETMMASLDKMWDKCWRNIQEKLRRDPESIYKALGKKWVKSHYRYFMRPYSRKNIRTIIRLMKDPNQKSKMISLLWTEARAILSSFDKKQFSDFLLLFDSSIFEVDNTLVKGLVEGLKKSNIYDKTIIIITADHGNEFKEHGHIGHGAFLYDESIHIPLILRLPNFHKTIKIGELAESVDILPTLLELLAVPIPYQSQGISLVKSMEEDSGALTNAYVLSQSISGLVGIRSKEWKLIIDGNERDKSGAIVGELFDIASDPHEQNNIIADRPDIVKDLDTYLSSRVSGMVIYRDTEGEFLPEIDKETRERIRKTGYW